jgi:hypothetical protein
MPICPALAKWLRKDIAPTKRLIWRKAETGNPGQLEFRRGGEVIGFLFGLAQLIIFSLWSWLLIQVSQDELSAQLTLHKLTGHYVLSRETILEAVLYGIFSCILFLKLMLGVWGIVGRERVTIDKTIGSITKSYRLLTVLVFERSYDINRASSVSFGPVTRMAKIIRAYFVCLQAEEQPPQRLFVYLGSRLHKQ